MASTATSVISGLMLAAAAPEQNPIRISPTDTDRMVETCIAPSDRGRPMAEFTTERRLAMMACLQRNASSALNGQLPRRLDDMTILMSTTAEGATLVYHNRLELDAQRLPADAPSRLEQATRQYVCAQPSMVQTIINGGSYGYEWQDRSGATVHRMVITSC